MLLVVSVLLYYFRFSGRACDCRDFARRRFLLFSSFVVSDSMSIVNASTSKEVCFNEIDEDESFKVYLKSNRFIRLILKEYWHCLLEAEIITRSIESKK